jgi:hypothetical protein
MPELSQLDLHIHVFCVENIGMNDNQNFEMTGFYSHFKQPGWAVVSHRVGAGAMYVW